MKKLIIPALICALVFFSCSKESVENSSNSNFESNNGSITTQKSNKVNVVHNNRTLSINENALLTHLNHGDKIGSVEDNVILQSIILNETPLDMNDPLFVSLRNSIEFQSYNTSFGALNLNGARMITMINSNAIAIPITTKDNNLKTELVSYITSTSSNIGFSTYVMSENSTCNNTEVIANITFCDKTGEFSIYYPTGGLIVDVSFEKNKILNYVFGEDPNERSCFSDCFKNSMSQCGGHFGCALACGLLSTGTYGTGCVVAFGSCCALDCALTGQSSNCVAY